MHPASASSSSKDPIQANIPPLRGGELGALYYGQRQKGDFYDFVRCSPDRVMFGLFDVAGDLEQARPVTIALQERFRVLAQKLFSDHGNEMEFMAEMWIQLNRAVLKAASGVHACSAFMGCYNEHQRTLVYVNCGHTPGLLKDTSRVSELSATALPLGLFSHAVPESAIVALGPGDVVLVISKGIVEARRRGEEFGLERAKEYLREVGFQTAHETCVGLLARVRQFMHTAPTHNDVTALSLVRTS